MPVIIELERTPNILEIVQVTATKSALNVGDVAGADHGCRSPSAAA
jgi:hypothetical protein